ncbi:MAG: hypothetical protein K2J40_11440 [Ruminococcus sp.]|nr:hypothetical protein [Ruminococcus sp.]
MNPELHKGHRERLRNRFMETEGAGFFRHEIIELLLFYIIPRANTNETAHMLIEQSGGSLSNLFELDIDELCSIKGVGENTALFIKFMSELSRIYPNFSGKADLSGEALDIAKYLRNNMSGYDCDYCVILNISYQFEIINSICIPMDEFLRKSTKELAAEIIQRNPHNIAVGIYHSKGLAIPNHRDYNLFSNISAILKALEIPLYDLMVFSKTNVFSIQNKGAFSF